MASLTAVLGRAAAAGEDQPRGSPPAQTSVIASWVAELKIDAEIAKGLWSLLDANPDDASAIEDLAAIPSQQLHPAVDGYLTSSGCSFIMMGRVSRLFARIAELASPPAAKAIPDQANEGAVGVTPPAGKAVVKKTMSNHLDQMDSGVFEKLTKVRRKELRANHITATGGKPSSDRKPSADQMAALEARLKTGDAPYVDFAV